MARRAHETAACPIASSHKLGAKLLIFKQSAKFEHEKRDKSVCASFAEKSESLVDAANRNSRECLLLKQCGLLGLQGVGHLDFVFFFQHGGFARLLNHDIEVIVL